MWDQGSKGWDQGSLGRDQGSLGWDQGSGWDVGIRDQATSAQ